MEQLRGIANMSNEVKKTQRPILADRANGQSMRKCDGAESQGRSHEATDDPKDRPSHNEKASNSDSANRGKNGVKSNGKAMKKEASIPKAVTDSITDTQTIDISSLVNVSTTNALTVDGNGNHVAMKPRESAYVTHIVDPNLFYMQLTSDAAGIAKLYESLQKNAPELHELLEFRVGDLCVGKSSKDGRWYRAKILDADDNRVLLQSIDYGHTYSITDYAMLKVPDPELEAHKPYAMVCSLPIELSKNSIWTEKARERLRTAFENPSIYFDVVCEYHGVNYVTVYLEDGRDVTPQFGIKTN